MNPVFVHAADLHLGAPLKSLAIGLDGALRKNLLELVDKAFDVLVEETINLNAEFLVLAGDIYDDAENDTKGQLRFYRGLTKLLDAGIGVYIVHGNHDPLVDPQKRMEVAKLPERVRRFSAGSVQSFVHPLRDGGEVIVAGVSFAEKHESENLALQFKSVERGSSQAIIGVLHTNVGDTSGQSNGLHGNYAPCKESDLRDSPIDYWALGHVHKRDVHHMGGNRYWAYPGNIQGRDVGEVGAKGALVVEILSNGVGEPVFFPCDKVRFAQLNLDCSAVEDVPGITPIFEKSLADIDLTRPLVCELVLTGNTRAHRAIKSTELKVLIEFLTKESGHLLNGGYIKNIEKQTSPPVDIDRLQNEDDLLGDLLRWTLKPSEDDVLEVGAKISEDAKKLLEKPETLNKLLTQIQDEFLNDLLTNEEDDSE